MTAPTERFTGLADVYSRHRPDYPAAAVDWILAHCGLAPGSLLVDLGCGTGISARLFAARGLSVVGVEPNDEMRRQAEQTRPEPGSTAPTYRAGRGEATGLPDDSADAVLAAQAFHWFEPDSALGEIRRILKPGGWVALVWNLRDESDPFTAAYGRALGPFLGRKEGDVRWYERGGEHLLASPLFESAGRVDFPNAQELDEAGVIGRAFSASYAPRDPQKAGELRRQLREAFAAHQGGGRVRLCYRTAVFAARKASAACRGG
jgi:SAM-dependent methyltransferase